MNGNTKGPSATTLLDATAKTKVDEFLRRQLGVADALDPATVVGALRKLYPSMAARLDDESRGVSIRQDGQVPLAVVAPAGPSTSPGMLHLRMMRETLKADLEAVVDHGSSRDYRSPLSGWRDAVLAELDEGEAAASGAADSARRDRAFYSVRKLGDYARVARMAGFLNPSLTPEFRRLASSLDKAAVVLRVLAGEALFRASFDEGGPVFQVTFEDLRQRRAALIGALVRFTSASSGGEEDWGDNGASYGALLRELSAQGQQGLRAIVHPEEMERVLNVLLDSVPRQQMDAPRGIVSTVPMELVQLRRLQEVAASLLRGKNGGAQAASAALGNLVQALGLFIDAFAAPGAGSRLLSIVLPAPLASLQPGCTSDDGNVRTLFDRRARLQVALDAVNAKPDFDPCAWRMSIKLDRVLHDMDRAIDLYLAGGGNDLKGPGPQARRAGLYKWVLEQLITHWETDLKSHPTWNVYGGLLEHVKEAAKALQTSDVSQDEKETFLAEQRGLEGQWKDLAMVLTLSSNGRPDLLDEVSEMYELETSSKCEKPRHDVEVPPPSRVSEHQLVLSLSELVQKLNSDLLPLSNLDKLPNVVSELEKELTDLEKLKHRLDTDKTKYNNSTSTFNDKLDSVKRRVTALEAKQSPKGSGSHGGAGGKAGGNSGKQPNPSHSKP